MQNDEIFKNKKQEYSLTLFQCWSREDYKELVEKDNVN